MSSIPATKRLSVVVGHLSHPLQSSVKPNSCSVDERTGKLLNGRVAIITGSGQGIGAAAAKLYAAHGAKVVVTDIDATKSDATAAEIRQEGGEAISVPGDITDEKFPERILEATISKFGELHIIVNNAGYTWDGMMHRLSDKQWEAMLSVHVTAPFRLIRAATPYMRDAGKHELKTRGKATPRAIINVSSTSGLHGNVGQANYACAKMGVVGFTKTVAKEWGPFGVRCNSIAFGFIQTRLTQPKEKGDFMQVGNKKVALGIPTGSLDEKQLKARQKAVAAGIPLRRPGTVEDAAGSLLFLASPLASYVSGHCLECTGGVGI